MPAYAKQSSGKSDVMLASMSCDSLNEPHLWNGKKSVGV